MDCLSRYLPDNFTVYYYAFIGAIILIALYLNDAFSKQCSYRGYKAVGYGYDVCNGPVMWRQFCSAANGERQSPINIITNDSIAIPSECCPLKFSEEFSQLPIEMKVHNNGINAIIYAKWPSSKRPSLSGGPLENGNYNLLNIKFRWGVTNDEGSEHMIDTKRFALEMQAAFARSSGSSKVELLDAACKRNLLIVSYFFMATPTDNPYLEPIVQALKHLTTPASCASICPFPLKLLTPVFTNNYFSYDGSLTFPPCTEGVKWIVQPEPLLVSSRQVSKFRKLGGCSNVKIACNSRPVQLPNGREVFFYD